MARFVIVVGSNSRGTRKNLERQPKWRREDTVKWLAFEGPLSESLYTLVLRLFMIDMIYQDQVSDLSGGSYE